MRRRQRVILAALVVAVLLIGLPIAWYLLSPLFISKTVEEDFPAVQAASTPPASAIVVPTSTTAAPALPTATLEAVTGRAATATGVPTTTPPPTTPVHTPTIPATAQANVPTTLRGGQFHNGEPGHTGSGTATIYQLADGTLVLRLENFQVTNGPDLYVYLSTAPDATNSSTVSQHRFLSLGRLKGNKGNQNYELPAGFDPTQYGSVVIWCQQFSVNFATAPLR